MMKHVHNVVRSKLTVTTCHTTAHVGTKLSFSHTGQLVSQTPCPRQVCFINGWGQLRL